LILWILSQKKKKNKKKKNVGSNIAKERRSAKKMEEEERYEPELMMDDMSDNDVMTLDSNLGNQTIANSHMRTIDSFILLQEFNGSFTLNSEFERTMGLSRQQIEDTIPADLSDLDNNIKLSVWVTILAVACLEVKFFDSKDEWKLISDKSLKFIKTHLNLDLALELINNAKNFIN